MGSDEGSEPASMASREPRRARFSLPELTRAAGVSTRTVRYYIAEGLLPPPEGAGPRSAYTDAHLDRLRLIGRLKAAYLPLKEIRRRLAGLSDDAVRDLLGASPGAPAVSDPQADDAAAYLDRVLGPRQAANSPTRASRSQREPRRRTMEAPAPEEFVVANDAEPFLARAEAPLAEAWDAAPIPFDAVTFDAAPVPESAQSPEDTDAWRRVPLGADAELLIRDETYQRRRDRVEWLVAWARKVLG